MGLDFFAIGTLGFYPTPGPTLTMKARVAYVATWGYISIGGWGSLGYTIHKSINRLGMSLTTT